MKNTMTINLSIDIKDYINKLEQLKEKVLEVVKLEKELNNTTIQINISGPVIAKEDIAIDKIATDLSRKIKQVGSI